MMKKLDNILAPGSLSYPIFEKLPPKLPQSYPKKQNYPGIGTTVPLPGYGIGI